jgi:hypothetical protein
MSLCAYEQERLNNIARNEAKLRALGLGKPLVPPKQPKQQQQKKSSTGRQKNTRSKGDVNVDFTKADNLLVAADKALLKGGKSRQLPDRPNRGKKNMRESENESESDDDEEAAEKRSLLPRKKKSKNTFNEVTVRVLKKDQKHADNVKALKHLHGIIYDKASTDEMIDCAISDLIGGSYANNQLHEAGFPVQIVRLHTDFWTKKFHNTFDKWYNYMVRNFAPNQKGNDGHTFLERYEGYDGPFYKSYLRYYMKRKDEQSLKSDWPLTGSSSSTNVSSSSNDASEAHSASAHSAFAHDDASNEPAKPKIVIIDGKEKQQCPVCKQLWATRKDGTLKQHDCAKNLAKKQAEDMRQGFQSTAVNNMVNMGVPSNNNFMHIKQEHISDSDPLPMPNIMPSNMPPYNMPPAEMPPQEDKFEDDEDEYYIEEMMNMIDD